MFGFNFGSKSSVNINGVNIVGKDIHVRNGVLMVDGVEYDKSKDIFQGKVINIQVHGNVEKLDTVTGEVSVTGNVIDVSTTSGHVKVGGNVNNVKTVSGDVQAKQIGSAKTVSGDISI